MINIFENDYLMRQIEGIVRVLSMTLLKKDLSNNILENEAVKQNSNSLYKDNFLNYLLSMINSGKINEAENILFNEISQANSATLLQTAISFYSELNNMSDTKLRKYNFSRDEILDGLCEIKKIYNVDDLTTFRI